MCGRKRRRPGPRPRGGRAGLWCGPPRLTCRRWTCSRAEPRKGLRSMAKTTIGSGAAAELEAGGTVPEVLSILPLRDTVLFPQAVVPLAAGREPSVRLIEDAARGGRLIGVFGQRDPSVEDPQQGDLYRVGTAGTVLKGGQQAGRGGGGR